MMPIWVKYALTAIAYIIMGVVILWIGRQCYLDTKREIRDLMADKKKSANNSKIIYLRYVDVEGREIIRKKKGAD